MGICKWRFRSAATNRSGFLSVAATIIGRLRHFNSSVIFFLFGIFSIEKCVVIANLFLGHVLSKE